MTTVLEVLDKLQTLGSADHIALFFRRRKVLGNPGAAYTCPVAHYLTTEASGDVLVMVSCYVITVYRGGSGEEIAVYSLDDENDPVSEFVTRFDNGGYSELVA